MARQRIEGTAALKNDEHYSYRHYCAWPEDERWELIAGTAYAMSPAPRRRHQGLAGALYVQLHHHFEDKPCRPYVAPIDVFLPEADEALADIDTVVQPDLLVVCDPTKLIDEGILGAPDFIIEILSPSSALRDQSEKRKLYEAKGVREYWIVNPDTLEAFMYRLRDGAYGLPSVASLASATAVAIFPGLELGVNEADLR
ncbi:MAG TPA: Uma2 family endonuclease [Rectinemataceae bacterium]|nr:Uma2 family endonuclease [Rectinemataceae bacterium]